MRRWSRKRKTRHPRVETQLLSDFLERSQRLERRFKRIILASTLGLIALIVAVLPEGRYLAARAGLALSSAIPRLLGFPETPEEIAAQKRLERERRMEATRVFYRTVEVESPDSVQHLLRISGPAPDTALLQWSGIRNTLLLSSDVFEPDEQRSYRLRPKTRAILANRLAIRHGITGVLLLKGLG